MVVVNIDDNNVNNQQSTMTIMVVDMSTMTILVVDDGCYMSTINNDNNENNNDKNDNDNTDNDNDSTERKF